MNFLFVSTMMGAPWGGSEELWHGAALQLRARGHQVTAAVRHWEAGESPRIGQLERAGCRVVRYPAAESRSYFAARLRRVSGLFRQAPGNSVFFERLARLHVDLTIISCGGSFPDERYWRDFHRRKVRYALLLQAASEVWWPNDQGFEDQRLCFQGAAAVYFVSKANRELVSRQLAMALPNASVVRNPFKVDYNHVLPWPAFVGLWKVAFVGRLEPAAKGCDLLLEVLSQPIWQKRNLTVSFFGGGDAQVAVRYLAAFLGAHRVEFKGFSTARDIWVEHQILVTPSRFEGLPLVVVEAMLAGRPCVVTDVAGNAELLEDGVTGFVAESPTVAALGRALERAWSMRENWEIMGCRAATAVRQQVPSDPAAVFSARLLENV